MANNKVEIEVSANVTGKESVGALGTALDSTAQSAKKFGTDAAGTAAGIGQADAATKGYTATSGKLRDGLESVSSKLDGLKTQMLQLVGVGMGTQGIKDLADLADAYKNLQARIKLVTGDGSAFGNAMQGVFDVAKRTNSAVEETGLLFTKLAEAGKGLGVSQAEALKLTETINQSVQLSGASAESSRAAIIQLVQGLQSGVLRGDEFNSVMEQSPRLAKALADGLGVTTGELRKLAEEGRLSSATVIGALQKQGAAIEGEFKQLPATVGRAMTNLHTEFQRYIGEADAAHGYSAKLAGGIDLLAGNLTQVASALLHAGQALGAMKLLSMAQEWLNASEAIKTTAAATGQASAATAANTAAKAQNTTATTANTAAQAANAKAWGEIASGVGATAPKLAETGTAAAAATPKVTALGAALSAIKTFALIDIALHFKEYGTFLGEWTAKLRGAKDATALLAAEEKRLTDLAEGNAKMRREQAAALQDALNRSFDLGKEGVKLIATFDDMRAKGDSAAEAVAKIGKDFDLANVPGIKAAVGVLDKLAYDGKISASEFQKAWADALKGQDLAEFETKFKAGMQQTQADAEKAAAAVQSAIARGLSGAELKAFKDKASEAFAATTRDALHLQQVLDASAREAIRRTGLDFDLISGGMGRASRSAINDTEAIITSLDRLRQQGVDVGQALTVSLSKGIKDADSEKALAAVRAQIEQVRKVLGDKIADGLLEQAKQKAEELRQKLEDLTPGIQSAKEAMRLLGITSDEAMKTAAASAKQAYDTLLASGTASARELSEGFKKAAEAAIAAGNGVAPAWVQAQAATRGYTLVVDDAGKATLRLASATHEAEKGMHGQASATDSATSALERQNAAIERQNAALEKALELERKRLNIDKEGYSLNTAGQKVVQQQDTQASVYNQARGAGLDEATALKLSKQFITDQGQYAGYQNANQAAGENWGTEVQKAINAAVLAAAQTKVTSGQQTNTQVYRVDLNVGGQQFAVNTANQSDAQSLIQALKVAKLNAGQ